MQIIESISSLLLGLWMMTGVTLSDGSSADLSYCQKKNSYQFNADGTFESQKHLLQGTKCASFPVKGKYKLSKDEKNIDLFPEENGKDKLTMGLVQVNERTLKLNIEGDIVTLTKSGKTPSNPYTSASPEMLKGKWRMVENDLIEDPLSDCDKKSFVQFQSEGKMVTEISRMEDGDCKTDSRAVPYHVTTDLSFLVIEPSGRRAVAMKIIHLTADRLILKMGRGKVTFEKE